MPIWTNHALIRLKERGISQKEVLTAFNSPDRSLETKSDTWEFSKKYSDYRLTILATRNDKNEWVIISCWRDPPLTGTKDHYRKLRYLARQKANFWGKLKFDFLDLLGW